MRLNRTGQGMLEYIIILAAVLLAIVTFVSGGSLKTTVRDKFLDPAATELGAAVSKVALE